MDFRPRASRTRTTSSGERICCGRSGTSSEGRSLASLASRSWHEERDLMTDPQTTPMPGHELKAERMPGHWLLARLGKRVLRPGGRQLTCQMIEALNIGASDAVIEFAPGLG